MKTPSELLEAAVRALAGPEKDNLRYHLLVDTAVLCGPGNDLWEGDGAGTPWALAGSRVVGEKRVRWDAPREELGPAALRAFETMRGAVLPASGWSLFSVVDSLTPEEARAAVERGIGP